MSMEATATAARRNGPWRTMVALVLALAAALLLAGASVLFWLDATVLDSARFSARVGAALDRPDVRERMSDTLAEQSLEAVNLENGLSRRLPDSLDFLSPIVSRQARTLIEGGAARLLDTQLAGKARNEVVLRLHALVLAVLRGDQDQLELRGDALVLDLRPIAGELFDRVGLNRPTFLDEQEGDFGTIVLVEDTGGLQQASLFVSSVGWLKLALLGGAVALLALSAVASRSWRRGIGLTGWAVAAAGAGTLGLVLLLNRSLAGSGDALVRDAIVGTLETGLVRQSFALAGAGAALVVLSSSQLARAITAMRGGAGSIVRRQPPASRSPLSH